MDKNIKTVFLYAGQGSQKVAMGKDIYDEYETYAKLLDRFSLDFDLVRMLHEGSIEEISRTKYTQPCMSAMCAGITEVLRENNITADAAMGLSLGEYGALYCAGVMDADTYVNLTAYRGSVMDEAAESLDVDFAMSAVLGTDAKTVEKACEDAADAGFVTLANYNCHGQYVVCGDESAVSKAEEIAKANGAKRCVRLNVSGPFHTHYMSDAGKKLGEYMRDIDFGSPSIPVCLNVTGDFLKDEDIKEILVRQIQSSVRFEDELKKVLEAGADTFVEIGPGAVLSGFLKKTAKAMGLKVEAYKTETVDDLKKVLDALA